MQPLLQHAARIDELAAVTDMMSSGHSRSFTALGRRGTVIAYRAYRCPADARGVRVRAMVGERILQLANALEAAREYVTARGPRER
jgi:hypothetical protein